MYSPRYDKAAEYRRLAEESRTLARQISINDARRQLLETAKHLELLAQEEERRMQMAGSKPEPKSSV
ncbi:hypothetical protein LJD17_20255 [Microvirga rosea]|nr:hypothetical protein [Microvirga rosea]